MIEARLDEALSTLVQWKVFLPPTEVNFEALFNPNLMVSMVPLPREGISQQTDSHAWHNCSAPKAKPEEYLAVGMAGWNPPGTELATST